MDAMLINVVINNQQKQVDEQKDLNSTQFILTVQAFSKPEIEPSTFSRVNVCLSTTVTHCQTATNYSKI